MILYLLAIIFIKGGYCSILPKLATLSHKNIGMTIRFFITYRTTYNQNIQLRLARKFKAGTTEQLHFPMTYSDDGLWVADIDLDAADYKKVISLTYTYQLHEHEQMVGSLGREMTLLPKDYKTDNLIVLDEWVR